MSDPQPPPDLSANLRGLLLNPTAADDRTLLEPPTPEELQAALPGYEVSRMIGRGGMGAVYLGRQISLDRKVAVKVLPPHLEGDDNGNFVERFKNEARAMARMNHPGIVAVYDFGQTDAGLLYFVMEFVEGTDVQRMISQQKRLKSAHAHAITAHVCDALAYAHERGLIHRDIKPANIMLSQEGEVKVADFGLAKAMNTNATNLTQSGMVMGTLHYMAPEAFILGAAVDHRADIYAVGVMLYQMLTGRVPSGVFELPSLQIPGLDPRFDDIITRAMREEREDRYQSAVAMRQDLDDMLTQPVPVKSTPPTTTPKIESSATKALPQATQPNAPPRDPPPERERFRPAKQRAVWGWGLATLLLLAGCGAYLWVTGVRVTFEDATAPLEPVASATPMPPVSPPEPQVIKPAPVPPAASATTAKPTTVAIPTPPAVTMTPPPAPKPPVVPATLDFSEYQQLNAAHSAIWQQHVRQPYDDGMALLSSQFVQALERGMLTSDPMKKAAFAGELQRFKADAQPPPASADADPALPAQIPQYRQTFRLQAARLLEARDLAAAGVTKEFLDALAALEKSQSANQQPGRAAGVKALHADLLEGRKMAADVLITTAPVVTAKPATAPSATAASQFALPDGTLKTGGRLVFEDNFDSGVISPEWKQQGKAWYCVTGLLGTTEAFLKDAKDNGWGCWLGRELPEYARIEFDIDFVGRGAVMVCELYATPPKGAASPAGTGYKLMFGEKGSARPVIQRGMTPLVSGGVNTNPVTASASTTHHIAIQRVDGQTLEWFIDGRLHARARDGDPKRGGWLGFQYQDGMALVDNVRVFDLDPRSQATAPATPVVTPPPTQTSTPPPAATNTAAVLTAAAPASPAGRPTTGGMLVFEEVFTAGANGTPPSANWICIRRKQGLITGRFDYAWRFEGAALVTYLASLRKVSDQGFGCWLLRTLPERARIEFDATLVGPTSAMVCEFYANTPTEQRSPAGSGYSIVFGSSAPSQARIQRGMTLLSGQTKTMAQTSPATKTRYHMVIQRVDGRTIEWFVDGVLQAQGADDKPKATGHLGFQFRGDAVRYENLRIYNLAVTPTTASSPAAPSVTVGSNTTAQNDLSQFEAITDLPVMVAYMKTATDRTTRGDSHLVVKINVPPGINPRHAACFTPQDVFLNQYGLGWVTIPDSNRQKRAVLTVIHPGCVIHEEPVNFAAEPPIVEREITLRGLDPQEACLFLGQVLNPDRSPAAQAIVRLADWDWTRCDDQGRFAIKNVSPGTLLARAESPAGEIELPLKFAPGTSMEHELVLKKANTTGIRWTLQREPENRSFSGPGVITGEAYFSTPYSTFSLERGASAHDAGRSAADFSLLEDKRQILYVNAARDGLCGWHEENLAYTDIAFVNQAALSNTRDYFYMSFKSRSPLKVGQVFTVRCPVRRNFAKLEIIHLPY